MEEMLPSQDGRHAAEKNSEKKSRIRYVQNLADENDQWITVPDAARMTKSSESMANRWVTSGRIPIRGNPETQEEDLVGLPARTRQVRLSDVKKIRPILYPEQAISTVVRTLDLTSIPGEIARLTLEHEQITTNHQQLIQQLSQLANTVDSYQAQLQQDIHQQNDDLRREAREQRENLEGALTQAKEQLNLTLQTLQNNFSQTQETVQSLQGEQETLATRIETYREQGQQALDAFAAEQQKALQTYQQAVDNALRQHEQTVEQRLAALEQRIESQSSHLTQQITGLDKQLAVFAAETNSKLLAATNRLDELNTLLSTEQRRTGDLEQTATRHQQQLTHFADLERTVTGYQQQLGRLEQLLSLPARIDYLYQVLADRGVLSKEQGKNQPQ